MERANCFPQEANREINTSSVFPHCVASLFSLFYRSYRALQPDTSVQKWALALILCAQGVETILMKFRWQTLYRINGWRRRRSPLRDPAHRFQRRRTRRTTDALEMPLKAREIEREARGERASE